MDLKHPSDMSLNNVPVYPIRDFEQRDFPELCALDRLCFAEGIAYTPDEVALGLLQPGAFALVAEAGQRVVAFILAYQKKRPLGHIVTIDVHPEFRRLGLGNRLMELAAQRLRERGAARIVLEVATQNEPAQLFYEKLGYRRTRLLRSYYSDGSDAFLMEKNL